MRSATAPANGCRGGLPPRPSSANALFGFVTGVSIAAAAAFSRIAYPEMRRYGYRRDFALGCVAGSACLGMLIPPSVLMIVWCVLTELSIGKLFLAGVIPGLARRRRHDRLCGDRGHRSSPSWSAKRAPSRLPAPLGADVAGAPAAPPIEDEEPIGAMLASTVLVIVLILGTLGAIWLGLCTPTEGAGVGAVGALILAVIKGIKPREVWQVVLDVGRTSGPLLLLLFCAQLYSRVLSMTGFTEAAKVFLLGTGAGPWGILLVMVAIWFVLGCLIDSISIILLTVPIFAPIAIAARLRSARLRHHRHPGDRDRPADAAVRHPGVHGQGRGARQERARSPRFSAARSPTGSCCWRWSWRWRSFRSSPRSCPACSRSLALIPVSEAAVAGGHDGVAVVA